MAHDTVSLIPEPHIQNVVSTFQMAEAGSGVLDLAGLTQKMPFVEYNPRKFAAALLRCRNPKTTCLVFASGKGVCAGAQTEEDSLQAAFKYVTMLRKAGETVSFQKFKIQNIVSAAHCPFRVDLHALSMRAAGFCSYEPSLFPGLVYRVHLPSRQEPHIENVVVFLVFQSGKCVITGGRDRQQVLVAWRGFYKTILMQFRSETDYGNSSEYRLYQSLESPATLNQTTIRTVTGAMPHRGAPHATADALIIERCTSLEHRAAKKLCDHIKRHFSLTGSSTDTVWTLPARRQRTRE